ncbi:hypothetical protein QYF61_006255 [Mycteria americana]|uniref:Secreted protein n=1 Tax=Mycteria americana TaxID=33587 RepID=A0AAN7MUB3_MYCAM|nr:hypothetical protein QYF61_006255 [Mycteria americana]
MLAGLVPLVILYMPCDGTQDDLLHQLPWHRERIGTADIATTARDIEYFPQTLCKPHNLTAVQHMGLLCNLPKSLAMRLSPPYPGPSVHCRFTAAHTVHPLPELTHCCPGQRKTADAKHPRSLSRSSSDFCSRPFTSFVALLWTRSSTSMSLL